MTVAGFARSIGSSTARRWRALRLRNRVALALLAVGLLIGGGSIISRLADSWPARATLKTPLDTWPLAFSPDGRDFLTAGEGGITRWDVLTGDQEGETWAIPGGEYAGLGAYSADGRSFAVSCSKGNGSRTVHLIDATNGRIRWSQVVPIRGASGLRFVDDGRAVRGYFVDTLSANKPMTAITWDAESGRELTNRPLKVPLKGNIGAISADGRTMALCPMRRLTVEVWDLETDQSLGSLMNTSSISNVNWGGIGLSADGKTLAVSREDGTLELWNVATRTLKATHSIGTEAHGLKFSTDGRTLAFDAESLRDFSTIGQIQQGLSQTILGGRRSENSEVIVIDLVTGRRLARASRAIHPHFSPDGRTVATRERDLSVKLRDVPRPAR